MIQAPEQNHRIWSNFHNTKDRIERTKITNNILHIKFARSCYHLLVTCHISFRKSIKCTMHIQYLHHPRFTMIQISALTSTYLRPRHLTNHSIHHREPSPHRMRLNNTNVYLHASVANCTRNITTSLIID